MLAERTILFCYILWKCKKGNLPPLWEHSVIPCLVWIIQAASHWKVVIDKSVRPYCQSTINIPQPLKYHAACFAKDQNQKILAQTPPRTTVFIVIFGQIVPVMVSYRLHYIRERNTVTCPFSEGCFSEECETLCHIRCCYDGVNQPLWWKLIYAICRLMIRKIKHPELTLSHSTDFGTVLLTSLLNHAPIWSFYCLTQQWNTCGEGRLSSSVVHWEECLNWPWWGHLCLQNNFPLISMIFLLTSLIKLLTVDSQNVNSL